MPYGNAILWQYPDITFPHQSAFPQCILPLKFCLLAKVCPKPLFKPLLLSAAGVHIRTLRIMHDRMQVVQHAPCSLVHDPLTPAIQPVVVFPVLGVPAPNVAMTLVAGCPKHKMSRFTATVRRILINDAMTVSTKVGRLMVTLSHGVTTIRCKSNTAQNVIKSDRQQFG